MFQRDNDLNSKDQGSQMQEADTLSAIKTSAAVGSGFLVYGFSLNDIAAILSILIGVTVLWQKWNLRKYSTRALAWIRDRVLL